MTHQILLVSVEFSEDMTNVWVYFFIVLGVNK
jgi:hypothetical protein